MGDTLFKQKQLLPLKIQTSLNAHILADISTPYKFIDAVKTQISSAYVSRVFYRTNDLEDISKGLGIRIQGTLVYKKVEKNEKIKNDNDEIIIFNIRKHPIEEFQDELYSQNFKKVKDLLKGFRYKKVKFLNGKKIKIGNRKIKLSNTEGVFNELKELDFYFISFSKNLCYGDYFKNISTIIKMYRSRKKDIPFIEISRELQKALEKNKVSL